MPRRYRLGFGARAVNAIFRRLALRGRGPHYLHVLNVMGRTSGVPRSVSVDVMKVGGVQYLVAPYGAVQWVRNLRAAGRATLRRGSAVQEYDAVEVLPGDAIPVIRECVRSVPITRVYWNVTDDATDDEVLEDARTHPVFALREPRGDGGARPRRGGASP